MTPEHWLSPWTQFLLAVISGLLGAIIGALIYGRVALRGIDKQILAGFKLQEVQHIGEAVAALRAIVQELRHNGDLLNANYVGYRAMALTVEAWQNLAWKLGPVQTEVQASMSLAYSFITSIRAVEVSNREELARAPGQAEGRPFIQQNWGPAHQAVIASIQAIEGELNCLAARQGTISAHAGL